MLLVIVWVTIKLHRDANQFVNVDLELTYMVNEYRVSFLLRNCDEISNSGTSKYDSNRHYFTCHYGLSSYHEYVDSEYI